MTFSFFFQPVSHKDLVKVGISGIRRGSGDYSAAVRMTLPIHETNCLGRERKRVSGDTVISRSRSRKTAVHVTVMATATLLARSASWWIGGFPRQTTTTGFQ